MSNKNRAFARKTVRVVTKQKGSGKIL